MHVRTSSEADNLIIEKMGNNVLEHHKVFDAFYTPISSDTTGPDVKEKLVFVATDDTDSVFGYVQGVLHTSPLERSYPYAVIQSIWVEEVMRGQGIAQKLIDFFEKEVKGKGARQIDILVDVRNTDGVALWDAAGYEIYQEKRRKLI